jgi:predicted ATPase/DNA-binding winged helix-turn-helix (wHTH) protein
MEEVERTFSFAEFELDTAKRRLLYNEENVILNPKALELLTVLVKNHGHIVTKNELLETVWKDQFVEENNLTVHISALRKIFGEKKGKHQFIVTISGEGYKFIADVKSSNVPENLTEKDLTRSDVEQNSLQVVSNIRFEPDKNLVGREREVTEIISLIRQDNIGLITLTGTGGAGKTSLAKVVGNNLTANFSDGVYFIELAAIRDAELVAPTIMQTLGIDESADQDFVETLKSYLHERQILLILDNFEQIISASSLVKELLNSSVGLKILITSRVAFQFENETEFIVKPLNIPPPESNLSFEKLQEYAAVELFIKKAKTVKSHFTLNEENAESIAGICRKLDGLPLAIELAAVRVKLLSPQSIFTRLQNSLNLLTRGANDLPERQRTMRETIRWSYDLLGGDEKILFRRLAVFVGSFTIEAAEAICEEYELEKSRSKLNSQTLDLLDSLIGNNLLIYREQDDGSVRLRMLEVVREFAFEMLEETNKLDELKRIHSNFFLALAEEAEPFLQGDNGNEWLKKLAKEHDNFREALNWTLTNNGKKAARIAAALRYFWLSHGHLSEGLQWSNAALEVTENTVSEARFKLLMSNGMFLRHQGNFDLARKVYEKALIESKETNDLSNIIKADHGLAAIAVLQKDFASAHRFCEEALALCRELKDEMLTAYILGSLGDLELSKRNPKSARPYIEECLEISKKLGNRRVLMTMYFNLGSVDYLENKYETAFENFTKTLQMAQDMENKTMISCSIEGFAAISASIGNHKQSVYLAGAAEGLRDAIGYMIEPAEEVFRNDYLSKVNATLDPKVFAQLYAQGKTMNPEECVTLLLTNGDMESEISNSNEDMFEIIIEEHKIERIIIEE